jgi:hypothetical protein
MGFRAPTERGSEIPRGDLGVGECRRYARGRLQGYALHRHAASKGCLLTFRQPIGDQGTRLGRCIDVHRTMPSVIPHRARRCRPTQRQTPAHSAPYLVSCSRWRRSIISAICSCSSAIFVKPCSRRRFARARCHFGDSSRDFSRSSSVDMLCAPSRGGAGTAERGDESVLGRLADDATTPRRPAIYN